MECELLNSTEQSKNTDLLQKCEDSIEQERNYTRKEVARLLNISEKTLIRWEERGMITRVNEQNTVSGNKRSVAFTREEVDRLIYEHHNEVVRATNFTQMTEDEIAEIISKIKEYLTKGIKKVTVITMLADETGRSIETIRYMIRKAEKNDTELSEMLRKKTNSDEILSAFLSSENIQSIALNFQTPMPTVNKTIRELLPLWVAKKQGEFGFVPNDEFEHIKPRSRQEEEVLADIPSSVNGRHAKKSTRQSSYFNSMDEVPLLTKEQEVHLFRKINYCKYRATQLCEELLSGLEKNKKINHLKRLTEQIKRIESEIIATKNHIIRANLRLVLSIAKRYRRKSEQEYFELVSDGNISLYRAADNFDFARGNKFSTYATSAITKNYYRTIHNDMRHHGKFQSANPEVLESIPDTSQSLEIQETNQEVVESCTNLLRGVLDERENFIIVKRFGLDKKEKPMTLEKIGKIMSITKERVRKLEKRAIAKLRREVRDKPKIAKLWNERLS